MDGIGGCLACLQPRRGELRTAQTAGSIGLDQSGFLFRFIAETSAPVELHKGVVRSNHTTRHYQRYAIQWRKTGRRQRPRLPRCSCGHTTRDKHPRRRPLPNLLSSATGFLRRRIGRCAAEPRRKHSIELCVAHPIVTYTMPATCSLDLLEWHFRECFCKDGDEVKLTYVTICMQNHHVSQLRGQHVGSRYAHKFGHLGIVLHLVNSSKTSFSLSVNMLIFPNPARVAFLPVGVSAAASSGERFRPIAAL